MPKTLTIVYILFPAEFWQEKDREKMRMSYDNFKWNIQTAVF